MFKDIYVCSPLDIRTTIAGVLRDISDITEERAFGVRLVLNELLANSVVHGSGTRTVFSYRLSDNAIDCTITDDGEWYAAPDISCSDVSEDHGRGIYLANHYADMLRYDEEQRKIFFKIRIK